MSRSPVRDVSCLALSGGVGGAKLALGLSQVLAPYRLTVVANTGDDFKHLGLHIAPDVDTVLYTLAGVSNPQTGWGRAAESWHFLETLEELGVESWFRLGDRDLALHVVRSHRLAAGASLSEVTSWCAEALGLDQLVVPMSDDRVRTVIHTTDGEDLAFQDYFVRERCRPTVKEVRFEGLGEAFRSPGFDAALADPRLGAVVLCPSNPFLSLDPILALTGVREALGGRGVPVIAVSPIVGGEALKGPAAKIMSELGMPVTAVEVARHYHREGLLDGFVLDEADAALAPEVEGLGLAVRVRPTVMRTLDDRVALARDVLELALSLG